MCDLTEDGQERLDRVKNVISNYQYLRDKEELEEKWIEAYLHASCFRDISFEDLKMVFDACDKEKLKEKQPLPVRSCGNLNPFTVFRGCVGEAFRPGMSWTTDLWKAIRYPKLSKIHGWYENCKNQPCSVWVALVEKEEIYCYLERFEPEFIACPQNYWKVDIPQVLFEYEEVGI